MTAQLEFGSPLAPPLPIHRFSVEQYHLLGELGVLTPEDKVELLEGWIVEKMNHRPIHGCIVGFLSEWFRRQLPSGFLLQCQLPITTPRSEPEPDIAIVTGAHQDFRDSHPTGKDCRLIIEVADTSLEKDRAKAAIYHSAGVEEYWIVNVGSQSIEQYRFSESPELQPPTVLSLDSQMPLRFSDAELTLDLRQIFS